MIRMSTFLVYAVLILTGPAAATGPLYKAPIVCPGGSYYYSVIAAELDNDGDPDLVVTDPDDYNVTVFLTHTDGTFAGPMTYDIQAESYYPGVADLNGDGYNDIIVGREIGYDYKLGVLMNTGVGTFEAPVDYDLYNTPYDIITADVDDDDDNDILIATHSVVQLYKNNGDGTFNAPIDINAAYNMNTGLAAADFDRDGDMDFAVNNYEFDSTQVFLNDGSGGFTSNGRFYSGHLCNSLRAALLNADLFEDLIVTNRSTNTISILMGGGDGTFGAPVTYTVGFDPQWADPADLDGDGDIDLAVATWTGKGISTLSNNGDGTFAAAVNYVLQEGPSVASGDFDKDGDRDLVCTAGGDALTVLYNDGDGVFPDLQKYAVGTKAWGVAIGHLDFNADLDIAVTNFTTNTVTTFVNNGDSTFTVGTVTDLPGGAGPKELVMADLDDNGVDEIITADFTKDSISVVQFGTPGATNYPAGDGPGCLATGFLNGDAFIDVVVGNANAKSFMVYINDGAGGLQAPASYPATDTPNDIIIADLDGDGDNDVAMANDGSYPDYNQRLFLNDSHGLFTPGPILPVSYWGNSVAAADMDGDGDNDIIFGQDDSKVTVYMNQGGGNFPDSVGYDMYFTPTGFIVADVDLDGDSDLVIGNKWEGYVATWYNHGDGTFDKTDYYRVGRDGGPIAGGDLDGDGDIDLVAATSTDAVDTLKILLNRKDLIPVDADGDSRAPVPDLFTLRQNYPNPFNPSTTIAYALPRAAEATITIYNLLGQTVRTLAQGHRPAGQYQAVWDGKDEDGTMVSSGVYFYRLTAGDFVGSKKMVLIK